jgi:hypothetical protein
MPDRMLLGERRIRTIRTFLTAEGRAHDGSGPAALSHRSGGGRRPIDIGGGVMRRMARATAVVWVTCAALVGTAATSAALPPDGLECGDTVSGTVTLTADLRCDDVGVVLRPGAVLDLGGHALVGQGRDGGGVALETTFEEAPGDPVVVRNGTVRDWANVFRGQANLGATLDGVVVQDNAVVADLVSSTLTFERSTFRRNGLVVGGFDLGVDVTGSVFAHNDTALSVGPPGSTTVRRSTFSRNGVAMSCSEGSLDVASSTFHDNATAVGSDWCVATVQSSGFTSNDTAFVSRMITPAGSAGTDRIAHSRFVGNDVALAVGVRSVVEDNVLLRNGTALVSQSAGTPLEVEDVTVLRNRLVRNGDGVLVDTAAHVGDNVALRNDGYGLNVPLATDLGGNVALGNGVDCVGVDCAP